MFICDHKEDVCINSVCFLLAVLFLYPLPKMKPCMTIIIRCPAWFLSLTIVFVLKSRVPTYVAPISHGTGTRNIRTSNKLCAHTLRLFYYPLYVCPQTKEGDLLTSSPEENQAIFKLFCELSGHSSDEKVYCISWVYKSCN